MLGLAKKSGLGRTVVSVALFRELSAVSWYLERVAKRTERVPGNDAFQKCIRNQLGRARRQKPVRKKLTA